MTTFTFQKTFMDKFILFWEVLELVPSVVPPQETKMRRSGPLQAQMAIASLPHTNYVSSLIGFHPPPHPFFLYAQHASVCLKL